MGVWWRWALFSPDGVVPRWMVGVAASVNLPLHHTVQKLSSGTCSWPGKRAVKQLCVCVIINQQCQSAEGMIFQLPQINTANYNTQT